MYLESATVLTLLLLPHVFYSWVEHRHPTVRQRLSPSLQIASGLLTALGEIFLIVLLLRARAYGLDALGLSAPVKYLEQESSKGVMALAAAVPFLVGGSFYLGILPLGLFALSLLPIAIYRKLASTTRSPFLPANEAVSQFTSIRQRAAFLFFLPVAAAQEELVYRGYFIMLLGREIGWLIPLVALSSILFSLGHRWNGLGPFLYYLWFSVFASLVAIVTKSLPLVIAFHATVNFLIAGRVWLIRAQRPKAS